MNTLYKKVVSSALLGCLLSLTATAFGEVNHKPANAMPARFYAGVFGGGGVMSSTDVGLFGTVYFPEVNGGPLAVNAFTNADSNGAGLIGAHIGMKSLTSLHLLTPVTPAIELESYYMKSAKIKEHAFNNSTRLAENEFVVSYNLGTSVVMLNAVLNTHHQLFGRLKPYLSVGVGPALVSNTGARAIQINPAEPGVNHFNSKRSDKAATFATQAKLGANYDLDAKLKLYAEYRLLYLAETNYTLGSTIFAGHAETSAWHVRVEPQYYNLAVVGVDYSF